MSKLYYFVPKTYYGMEYSTHSVDYDDIDECRMNARDALSKNSATSMYIYWYEEDNFKERHLVERINRDSIIQG